VHDHPLENGGWGTFYHPTITDKTGEAGLNQATFDHIKGFIFTDGTVIEDGETIHHGPTTEYELEINALLNADDMDDLEGDITLTLHDINVDNIKDLVDAQGNPVDYDVDGNDIIIRGLTEAEMEGLVLTVKTDADHGPWSVTANVYTEADGDTYEADDSIHIEVGTDGADTLTGTNGDDVLIGGPGDDELFGGPGDDTFLWQAGDQGTSDSPATDTII